MVSKSEFPQAGKCDLIKGILLGFKETKRSRNSNRENTPSSMIGRFSMIVQRSSSEEDKAKAYRAIELLSTHSPDQPISESERRRLLNKVSANA